MSQMKIAMVGSSVSRAAGGIFEVERRLSLQLVSDGHEIGVFAGTDIYTKEDLNSWFPIIPYTYPVMGLKSFGYSPGLSVGLKSWNPDIVHLHMLWMYPSVVVKDWSERFAKPAVITLHGMLDCWALKNSSWKKKLALLIYERKNLNQASCIQVLSEAEARSARDFGLKNPIAIIPNAIDISDNSNYNFKFRHHRKVLLFLGRLHPKKGLKNLLMAWKEIHNNKLSDNWVLIIAGWSESNHGEELKKIATELGILWSTGSLTFSDQHNCDVSLFFPGSLFGADKESFLKKCDAFILPSFSEGLPMSVLEAWAYSKPVIMTPMCNLSDGFTSEAAIRAEPNVTSLHDALLTLMRMTDRQREEIGANGRCLVERQYSWSRVGSEMATVYKWLIHGGEVPACVRLT